MIQFRSVRCCSTRRSLAHWLQLGDAHPPVRDATRDADELSASGIPVGADAAPNCERTLIRRAQMKIKTNVKAGPGCLNNCM
jgi:hypothetical protein